MPFVCGLKEGDFRTRVQLPRVLVWFADGFLSTIQIHHLPCGIDTYHLSVCLQRVSKFLQGLDLLLLVRGEDAVLESALPLVLDTLDLVIGAQHVVYHIIVAIVTVIQLVL